MGTVMQPSKFGSTPIVLFGEREGSVMVGTLKDKRPAGKGQVYTFLYESGDVVIGMKTGQLDAKGRNLYNPAIVKPGDEVAVFSDTELSDYIGLQTNPGTRLKITFVAWIKNKDTSKSPRKHYQVEIL